MAAAGKLTVPRALMIISLDFEQFSARLFAAAHARIWPISNVRVFVLALGTTKYAAESPWMLYEQCRWAKAAPAFRWSLEQSAAKRYWRGHQRVEKAIESIRACRWTTFWTFIVSACYCQKLWTNKIQVSFVFFHSQKDAPLLLRF